MRVCQEREWAQEGLGQGKYKVELQKLKKVTRVYVDGGAWEIGFEVPASEEITTPMVHRLMDVVVDEARITRQITGDRIRKEMRELMGIYNIPDGPFAAPLRRPCDHVLAELYPEFPKFLAEASTIINRVQAIYAYKTKKKIRTRFFEILEIDVDSDTGVLSAEPEEQ